MYRDVGVIKREVGTGGGGASLIQVFLLPRARVLPRKYIFHPDGEETNGRGAGERRGRNYAFVRERQYNLIFSLLRRTLVGSRKAYSRAKSPARYAKKKQRAELREREREKESARGPVRGIRPAQRFPVKTPVSARVSVMKPRSLY